MSKNANGTIYCDECHLEIGKLRHVRIPRPTLVGQDPKPDAHFHNRLDYTNDCWSRVKKAAEVRKKATTRQLTFAFVGQREVIQ